MAALVKEPKEDITITWEPQPGPQSWLISCPVFETLFGGARGGGKSDGVLGEFATHADMYGANAIGLCVRRERTQLRELIERSLVIYTALGAKYHALDKMWRFPNGARLAFAYLESDSDAQAYQGHSYTRVYIEEMGTFPNPDPIFKLMATLRSGAGVPCRFIATANPGGPGHLWIKQRYIDPAPLGMRILPTTFKNPFTGELIHKERIFIPSKITDNKYTNTADYIGNLYLAGNEELVRAWLLGDWNVMLGAFFQEWDTKKHVIKEFQVPRSWTRFMAMDWGSSKPFSVGWYAVVPGEMDYGRTLTVQGWVTGQRMVLPKGALVRYREWYGAPKDINHVTVPNVGLKLTAEEVAKGIVIREQYEPRNSSGRAKMVYRVGDPSMHREDGGPSLAERMSNKPYYVDLIRADNKRIGKLGALGGWDIVRQRLKGDDGVPMIYFMDSCPEAIRTLPALQHNELNLEDADTNGEDHCPDEIRYACMSRPYVRSETDTTVREILLRKDNSLVIHDDLNNLSEPSRFNNARI